MKILRQKRLFKKQNGERKTIHDLWTNRFIQTFHFQLVLNGPYLNQCWRLCRTTRFVIWELFYWWYYEIYLWGINQICSSQGNHSFTIDTNTLKAFIAILLVSGYADMRRRLLYWEHNEDTHNTTVSSLLSRNRFDEIMQNLHLAHNSNLNEEDKFVKVRPLIDKSNEQCLANYLPQQSVSINESMVPYFGIPYSWCRDRF